VIGGEAGGNLGEGVLDGGAVVEAGEFVGVVLDDGGDVLVAVVEAHDFVVHGASAATLAVLVGVVHALVRHGGFAAEFLVDGHFLFLVLLSCSYGWGCGWVCLNCHNDVVETKRVAGGCVFLTTVNGEGPTRGRRAFCSLS
jgi:hypothetical protein